MTTICAQEAYAAAVLSYVPYSRRRAHTEKALALLVGTGYTLQEVPAGHEKEARGVNQERNTFVVSYRGTRSLSDLLTDLHAYLWRSTELFGFFHPGFMKRARKVDLNELTTACGERRLVLTGHSSGAAVAAMVALRLLTQDPSWATRLQVYLMGPPLYASDEVLSTVEERGWDHLFTVFIHECDPIPRLLNLFMSRGARRPADPGYCEGDRDRMGRCMREHIKEGEKTGDPKPPDMKGSPHYAPIGEHLFSLSRDAAHLKFLHTLKGLPGTEIIEAAQNYIIKVTDAGKVKDMLRNQGLPGHCPWYNLYKDYKNHKVMSYVNMCKAMMMTSEGQCPNVMTSEQESPSEDEGDSPAVMTSDEDEQAANDGYYV